MHFYPLLPTNYTDHISFSLSLLLVCADIKFEKEFKRNGETFGRKSLMSFCFKRIRKIMNRMKRNEMKAADFK